MVDVVMTVVRTMVVVKVVVVVNVIWLLSRLSLWSSDGRGRGGRCS